MKLPDWLARLFVRPGVRKGPPGPRPTPAPRPRTAGIPKWLTLAQQLEMQGKDGVALQVLYRSIEQMLLLGRFQECDDLLRTIETSELSTKILLGILTVTLKHHAALPSRPDFFKRVELRFCARNITEPGVLAGLG